MKNKHRLCNSTLCRQKIKFIIQQTEKGRQTLDVAVDHAATADMLSQAVVRYHKRLSGTKLTATP